MTLAQILAWLDATLNPRAFVDVSNNGLQIARRGDAVARVAFGVDADVRTVAAAGAAGAQLLVVHHGISWGGGLARLTGGVYNVVRAAMDADLALYAAHLPLDAHPALGNNRGLARFLALRDLKPAFAWKGTPVGLVGRGRLQTVQARLRRLAPHVPLPDLSPARGATVSVGLCSGGGGGFAEEARALGCDLFVTGEADWGETVAAANAGMPMVCAGHYETETFGVAALARAMARALHVETTFIGR